VEVHLHTFLATVLDEGKWSALNPGHFTHSGRASVTYWMGERGWLGPWVGRNVSKKKKISWYCSVSNSELSVQTVT